MNKINSGKYLIVPDFMFCLFALKSFPIDSHVSILILQTRSLSYNLIEAGYNNCITFLWISAHVGISSNEIADYLAKRSPLISLFPSEKNSVSDLVPIYRRHISSFWNQK